jgi:hypothetical protein
VTRVAATARLLYGEMQLEWLLCRPDGKVLKGATSTYEASLQRRLCLLVHAVRVATSNRQRLNAHVEAAFFYWWPIHESGAACTPLKSEL